MELIAKPKSSLITRMNHEKLCQDIKQIHDSIHGYIPVTKFAITIIDNPIFQRLRCLKQLGTCNFVYPNAVHTRFEHSIGTYHIANKLLHRIASSTDPKDIDTYLSEIPEIQKYYQHMYDGKLHLLDNYICELIKIAGLCHDLGHGPFSHIFDDAFIPSIGLQDAQFRHHEARSGALLERIIKSTPELAQTVTDDEIQFMKNIINPTKSHSGFIYQIVSNNLNGLDVDKYDYLTRDTYVLGIKSSFEFQRLVEHIRIINNNICYPEQATADIYNLFITRHTMHRTVYAHKGVISAQYIIVELLTALNKILKISDSLNDLDKFIQLTDEYIIQSVDILENTESFNKRYLGEIKKAKQYVSMLKHHKLYVHIGTFTSKTKIDIDPEKLFPSINPSDIIIFTNKIGFVSGNKSNPFENIYIFKTKHSIGINIPVTAYKCDHTTITQLMPPVHQEYITMVFYKQKMPENIMKMKSIFQNFHQSIQQSHV